jgi:hypothetical protein
MALLQKWMEGGDGVILTASIGNMQEQWIEFAASLCRDRSQDRKSMSRF